MASARFLEILRCRGVDQDATPHAGMIVPFKGENQVVLETYGMDVQLQSAVKLQEFDGRDLTVELLRGVQDELSKPGTDPQQKEAFMPSAVWPSWVDQEWAVGFSVADGLRLYCPIEKAAAAADAVKEAISG